MEPLIQMTADDRLELACQFLGEMKASLPAANGGAIATSFRRWMRTVASRWKQDGAGLAPARQLHGVGAT